MYFEMIFMINILTLSFITESTHCFHDIYVSKRATYLHLPETHQISNFLQFRQHERSHAYQLHQWSSFELTKFLPWVGDGWVDHKSIGYKNHSNTSTDLVDHRQFCGSHDNTEGKRLNDHALNAVASLYASELRLKALQYMNAFRIHAKAFFIAER